MTTALAIPLPYQLPNISGAGSDQQLIDLWLRGKKSQHTKKAYQQDLKLFGDFCATLPLEAEDDVPARPQSLRDVRAMHVQLFVEHCQVDKGSAPATVKRRLAALKSLLSYAQKTGYLPFNVAVVVSAPDAHRDVLNKILSVQNIEDMLNKNSAGRDRALLYYMYYSGTRVSETVKLRVRDLYRPSDTQLTVTVIGKRNKQRIIPLPVGKLWPILGPYIPKDKEAYVFAGRKGHLSVGRAYKIVKLAARLSGCPQASPHCLRHSHASHAIRNGAPVHVIQQTLGHANVATTSVYLHAEAGESSGMYL